MQNVQKMICEAFGYKEPLAVTEFTSSAAKIKQLKIVKDNELPCSMCGNIHHTGYSHTDNCDELMKLIISDTTNELYNYTRGNNFICEYCGYSTRAYGPPSKSKHGKKMVEVLIQGGKPHYKNFNADKKNELYGIIKNPPEPPFVILKNTGGTVIQNLIPTAKATISKELLVINYGSEVLEANPDDIFRLLEDVTALSEKYNIKINSEAIWNRVNDVVHGIPYLGKDSAKTLEEFYQDMGLFISKYDRDHRIVGKLILEAYLDENKDVINAKKVDTKKVSKNTTEQTEKKGLFGF